MFLGIEIGGTKLRLGLGNGDGAIAALWRGTVNPADGGDGIRKQIVAAMPELFARAGIERGSLRASASASADQWTMRRVRSSSRTRSRAGTAFHWPTG